MKYGRWKREAKRLQAEYRRLQMRPFNALALFPHDYEEGNDATPYLQHALDHMTIGRGGVLQIGPGVYRTTAPLKLEDAAVDGLRLPLPSPQIVIRNTIFGPHPLTGKEQE